MDIGKKIREIRKANNQKLLNISQETGLSQPYISEIERGIKSPSMEALEKICTALGVTLSDFFADTQQAELLTPEIRQATELLRQLHPSQLETFTELLEALVERNKSK